MVCSAPKTSCGRWLHLLCLAWFWWRDLPVKREQAKQQQQLVTAYNQLILGSSVQKSFPSDKHFDYILASYESLFSLFKCQSQTLDPLQFKFLCCQFLPIFK